MLGSRMRVLVTVVVCTLLLTLAAGCVRSKPEREREPLPTLPSVEAAIVEAAEEATSSEDEAAAETADGEPADAEGAEAEGAVEEGGEAEGAEAEEVVPDASAEATAEPTAEPTATPEPTPEPTEVPDSGSVYTVMPGDTLGTIAEAHGSTVAAFMEANELSSITLRVGQQLRLPAGVEPLWDTDVENTAIHIIRAGETLNDIGARYRMPVGQIMALNTWLKDPTLIKPGQELTVVVQPLDPNAIVHVIQAGESLASIALQYGVSVEELADYNYIVDPNRVFVGQQVVIPQ